MKNKVAYITGSSKGIGFGIAEVLTRNGIRVAISGRNEKDIQEAAERLKANGAEVLAIVSDVKNPVDEVQAITKITETFGQLDFVIANAGLGVFKPVDELSHEEWSDMIDTNLTGCFNTLKATVEELKKTEGYYITISSLAGANFFEKAAGYNASKFGVVGFTQAAMLDLRKYGIKAATIMPGSVSTFFNGNQPDEGDAWKIQPEDIGELVLDILKMNPRTLPSKIEVRPAMPSK